MTNPDQNSDIRPYRQGDVILQRIASLPAGVAKRPSNIIAEGEFSGHTHSFPQIAGVETYMDPTGAMFVSLDQETILTHQEHQSFPVSKGIYQVWTERELTLTGQFRSMKD